MWYRLHNQSLYAPSLRTLYSTYSIRAPTYTAYVSQPIYYTYLHPRAILRSPRPIHGNVLEHITVNNYIKGCLFITLKRIIHNDLPIRSYDVETNPTNIHLLIVGILESNLNF